LGYTVINPYIVEWVTINAACDAAWLMIIHYVGHGKKKGFGGFVGSQGI